MTQENSDITPFCQEKIRQLDEHLKDSPSRITEIARNAEQLARLKQDHEDVMDDIKIIKLGQEALNTQVSGLELKMASNQTETKNAIKNIADEIKLWVVSGLLVGLVSFSGVVLTGLNSFGIMNRNIGETSRQVDIDTRDIDVLKGNHPAEISLTDAIKQKD